MIRRTDVKKPTGDSTHPAGCTDTAQFTAMARLLAQRDTINTAALRTWCVSPSPLIRGRIRAKAKAPVRKNTFGQAVATPTDKRGFAMPKFLGLVRLHRSRMVYGHGGGYPQGRPHGLSRVLNHHAHPLRVRTHRVVLKSRQGAPTMHPSNLGSAAMRTPIQTGPTEEERAYALLQALSSASLARLYLHKNNVPAARRQAVLLLKTLQTLEVTA